MDPDAKEIIQGWGDAHLPALLAFVAEVGGLFVAIAEHAAGKSASLDLIRSRAFVSATRCEALAAAPASGDEVFDAAISALVDQFSEGCRIIGRIEDDRAPDFTAKIAEAKAHLDLGAEAVMVLLSRSLDVGFALQPLELP